jgi:hypothetical protein
MSTKAQTISRDSPFKDFLIKSIPWPRLEFEPESPPLFRLVWPADTWSIRDNSVEEKTYIGHSGKEFNLSLCSISQIDRPARLDGSTGIGTFG